MATVCLSALGGAGVALILDPRSGARRRGLMRDKARHYARIGSAQLRRRARQLPGPIRGLVHALMLRSPWHEIDTPPDQDEYIKHRVESALGRQRGLSLSGLNFDAADGVVRVRGTIPDDETAERIVRKVMSVNGVRAVFTYLRTPDSRPIQTAEGDPAILNQPRAVTQTEHIREQLMNRWPALNDDDILDSHGHLGRLTGLICTKTAQPEDEVRRTLDMILTQAAMQPMMAATVQPAMLNIPDLH
jgi:hypothetical protein